MVSKLVARGVSNAELIVSETTVKAHVARVLMKLEPVIACRLFSLPFETRVVAPGP
jgi:ATP/maltotriose-dependent transcriptional regulator MalT